MINKKVMLITGTGKSIGEYLARFYLKQGFNVIGCSRQKAAIKSDNYRHYNLDIRDEKAVKDMFFDISKEYGSLSVLINNAGTRIINHALLTDFQAVNNVMATNMTGAFLMCREAAKLMQKNNFGRIINISSIAVPLGSVGNSIYSASKAALEQFSLVFAKEVAVYGITVNVLGLSIVQDSGMSKDINMKAVKETLDRTIIKVPITFKDISNAINFYISEQSATVTGQTLYLGGV